MERVGDVEAPTVVRPRHVPVGVEEDDTHVVVDLLVVLDHAQTQLPCERARGGVAPAEEMPARAEVMRALVREETIARVAARGERHEQHLKGRVGFDEGGIELLELLDRDWAPRDARREEGGDDDGRPPELRESAKTSLLVGPLGRGVEQRGESAFSGGTPHLWRRERGIPRGFLHASATAEAERNAKEEAGGPTTRDQDLTPRVHSDSSLADSTSLPRRRLASPHLAPLSLVAFAAAACASLVSASARAADPPATNHDDPTFTVPEPTKAAPAPSTTSSAPPTGAAAPGAATTGASAPSSPAPAGATWAAPSGAAPPAAGAASTASKATWGESSGGNWISDAADAANLTIKAYGDIGYSLRDNTRWTWASESHPPGVPGAFDAAHLDLFGAANVDRLSFLTEIMFEPSGNEFGVDIERLQLTYLFVNWLRVRAGRTHVAWGYYNDTYHHGNIFELTTGRPYAVAFEDQHGLLLAHNVGVGIDGTIEAGALGSFRYDAEVGNGRPADITTVGVQFSEKTVPAFNVRLRWMPIEGLIVGVNGMRDVVPALDSTVAISRPETTEYAGGAHVVYTEHHMLIDVEAFLQRHKYADGSPHSTIHGGFAELGYTLGTVTPYVRPEYIGFSGTPDQVYQFAPNSAQASTEAGGATTGPASPYYDTRGLFDLRLGVKWMPLQQLALKLEVERLSHDSQHQEIASAKAAFGF